MTSNSALDAAAQARRARLAQLKSLKRKQPDTYQDVEPEMLASVEEATVTTPASSDLISAHLSGRNYDPTVRGPRLGFENTPTENQITLESQAQKLAAEMKAKAAAETAGSKSLDLFSLQPKKPNWDLKRDLERKLEVLSQVTDNAIARLVRDRIESAQKKAVEQARNKGGEIDGEGFGMEGKQLVQAMHVREQEDQDDAKSDDDYPEIT